MRRRICVITGSRAEYGILVPLIKEISDCQDLNLQLIATGVHLSSEFGLTYRQIEKNGFKVDRKVKMLFPGDTESAISKSVGLGVEKLTEAVESLKPDLVVLLGDRFEIFSAAVASFLLKIPIAHLHGGELTEGSLDEGLRHVITKLSFLHFVSTDAYKIE